MDIHDDPNSQDSSIPGEPHSGADSEGDGKPVPELDPLVDERLKTLVEPSADWQENLGIFLLTLILFLGSRLSDDSVSSALLIVAALLVHEVGHLVGMVLLGFSNIRLFFIPFFGAAVSGRNLHAPAWKHAPFSLPIHTLPTK